MSTSLALATIAVVVSLGCAVLGAYLRTLLPSHHLEDDTRDMVKVGVGLLATLTALVLGLLLAAGKSSFENMSEQAQVSAVKIVLLDHQLRQLGSAAEPARSLLRQAVSLRIAEIWGMDAVPQRSLAPTSHVQEFFRALASLGPAEETQQKAWSKSVDLADELAEIGFLSRVHVRSALTTPLVVLILLWLGIIALGLNIYAPRNATIHAVNVLSALSFAGAIFVFLEMDQPYGGMLKISPAPLQAALVQLQN